MEPIIEFTDDEQMKESLKEWKHRLFLDDWLINIKKADRNKIDNDDGQVKFNVVCKTATIFLAHPDDITKESIEKCCQEQILVHELLHLKYNWLVNEDTYESKYLDTVEHTLLEQMAKSLIMAKYNIGFEWFQNF